MVFSDAGSSLNLAGKNRLNEYFEMLNESSLGNLRFQMKYIEKFWTSSELFEYFKLSLSSDIANSGQLVGGHILLKKNENSMAILNAFEKLLNVNSDLITDSYSSEQIEGFKEHRHDQSIWSILSKIHGSIILNDETGFEDNKEEQYKYPFLAVQKRKYSLWQKTKFYLLYPINVTKTVYFGEDRYLYQKPSIVERIVYKFKNV